MTEESSDECDVGQKVKVMRKKKQKATANVTRKSKNVSQEISYLCKLCCNYNSTGNLNKTKIVPKVNKTINILLTNSFT